MFKDVLEFLNQRKLSYQLTFEKDNVHVKFVLKDLAKFCRAHETTFHADARVHAVIEGRREVWLRIQEHLNLSAEDLADLYRKD